MNFVERVREINYDSQHLGHWTLLIRCQRKHRPLDLFNHTQTQHLRHSHIVSNFISTLSFFKPFICLTNVSTFSMEFKYCAGQNQRTLSPMLNPLFTIPCMNPDIFGHPLQGNVHIIFFTIHLFKKTILFCSLKKCFFPHDFISRVWICVWWFP